MLEKCYDIDHIMKVGVIFKDVWPHIAYLTKGSSPNQTTSLDPQTQAKTIREFDERFTSIMFGYPTNDDYYHDASPVHKLKSVQVPMLCLNAADDVFSPSHGESQRPSHGRRRHHDMKSDHDPIREDESRYLSRVFPPAAIPVEAVKQNPNLAMLITCHGGHIGFLEGLWPRQSTYMDRVYRQFTKAVFEQGSGLQDLSC